MAKHKSWTFFDYVFDLLRPIWWNVWLVRGFNEKYFIKESNLWQFERGVLCVCII